MKNLPSAVFSRLERILADDLLLSVAVLFLPILYMVAALSLITNIGLGRWVLPTGLSLFIISVLALHRQEKWQKLVVTISSFLLAFALIVLLSSQLIDIGYDTRVFHDKAVLAFANGVNPFYEPLKWVTYAYPVAHWLLSSSLILWTNSFEASFAFTAPAVVAAFICSWRFLKSLHAIPRNWQLVLAFLLAANPITIWCFFAHFADGVFVSVLLSSFMLMLEFVTSQKKILRKTENKNMPRHAIYILASLILLINIKFTGLVYGAVLGLTALIYGLTVNNWSKQVRTRLLQLAGLGALAATLAVLCFGFFPYATNMIEFKNPFDSAFKERALFIKGPFDPEFINKSRYGKWWISIFSKQGEDWFKPAPLPPFSSIYPFSFYHGFGSFFSGAMLLSLTLVLFIRNKGAWIIISGVVASIFIIEVGFHIRITPQNWWLPIMVLVFFLEQSQKKVGENILVPRGAKIMATVIVACLLCIPILRFNKEFKKSTRIAHIVKNLKEQGGWYVTSDLGLRFYHHHRYAFLDYYQSGLTGVELPTIEECPINTEKRKLLVGLVVCRPQK